MDFEKADFGSAAAGPACAVCTRPLEGSYFSVNGRMVCADCAEQLRTDEAKRGGIARVAKATSLGCAGGLVGATVYGLVLYFTEMNVGLLTLLVGWLVGRGMRLGTGGRGGLGYQITAALLTYATSMMAFAPILVRELSDGGPVTATHVLVAPFFALAVPFMGGLGVIGYFILAFGMWQAFSMLPAATLDIAGPFDLSPANAPNSDAPTAAADPGTTAG